MVASHSPRLLPPAAIRGDKLLQRRMPDHFFVGAEVAGMQVSGTVGEAKEESTAPGQWLASMSVTRAPST